MDQMLLINTASAAKSPAPSEVSPTPSLDSTGSDRLKYLEEDTSEDDLANVVVGRNTRCLICNYVFHSETDFVNHGRVHFGNSFQKDHQVPTLPKVTNIGLQIFVISPFYIFVTFN
jgi:hypothetical protein